MRNNMNRRKFAAIIGTTLASLVILKKLPAQESKKMFIENQINPVAGGNEFAFDTALEAFPIENTSLYYFLVSDKTGRNLIIQSIPNEGLSKLLDILKNDNEARNIALLNNNRFVWIKTNGDWHGTTRYLAIASSGPADSQVLFEEFLRTNTIDEIK